MTVTSSGLTKEQLARVDVKNQTVTSKAGDVYRYTLERKRAWNIGLRRHVNELTGNIILYWPRNASLAAASNWPEVFTKIDKES